MNKRAVEAFRDYHEAQGRGDSVGKRTGWREHHMPRAGTSSESRGDLCASGCAREYGRSSCQASSFHGPASSRDKPAPTKSLPTSLAAVGR